MHFKREYLMNYKNAAVTDVTVAIRYKECIDEISSAKNILMMIKFLN